MSHRTLYWPNLKFGRDRPNPQPRPEPIEARFASSAVLAASITLAGSRQAYYIVRFLADRDRLPDAYRAYAYFRWLDDRLDQGQLEQSERVWLVRRQAALINRGYQGLWPGDLTAEERLLADLIRGDRERHSGLQSYIRNMLAVMAFDAGRRGRLISQAELTEYSRRLATAVTEALHFFIGHQCRPPRSEKRYLAATAAHITHMLRDTCEDNAAGYFNIPGEFLESAGITPHDIESRAYRAWVRSRVGQARDYFQAGREYLAQVANPRCRLAGYAYSARFERVLEVIERDGYRLRPDYSECKPLSAGLGLCASAVWQSLGRSQIEPASRVLGVD